MHASSDNCTGTNAAFVPLIALALAAIQRRRARRRVWLVWSASAPGGWSVL